MIPQITVLMSVYNGQDWLKHSIPSVLMQTLDDFEFVIVNDGSTDNSDRIIREYAKLDPRVRFIDKDNTGLADSLNHGIFQARGKWIARIDADDVCRHDRLENQLAFASTCESYVLIGSGLVEINNCGDFLRQHSYPIDHENLLARLHNCKGFFSHSSAFYRTDAVKAVGGYRKRLDRAQDYDLWLRLSDMGKIGCIDLPLVQVRKHESQISHTDGGLKQLLDSRVALVAHHLRHSFDSDPLDFSTTDDQYSMFREFVQEQFRSNDLFEYRKYVSSVKDLISTRSFKKLFFSSPSFATKAYFISRYFKEKIVGDNFPLDVAHRWIKEGVPCAE